MSMVVTLRAGSVSEESLAARVPAETGATGLWPWAVAAVIW
jgi:predicted lysophospholipase L1 biosynthesis ABC-type transport system permease subunit